MSTGLANGQTMKAGVLFGARDVRVIEQPVPEPGPGEMLIRVEAALTDGTDLKVYRRGYHAKMIALPAPFGHELAGVIAAEGPEVKGWRVGDRVVPANSAPCGHCFHCVRSEESLCEDLLFLNGAYAEFVLAPERLVRKNLLRVPNGMPPEHAAFTEPLACVVKGICDLGVRAGETVAVVGSGPIGLMATRLAALEGAEVILVGRRHFELGHQLGAQQALDASDIPLKELLQPLNGGRGPDRIFEATGRPEAWEQAIEAVRSGGAVNLFGGCPAGTRVSFDTGRVHYGEVRLIGSFHHTPGDIRAALELLERGALDPALLLDGEEPLDRLPVVLQEMDQRLRTLKTVIRPAGSRADGYYDPRL